MIDFARRQGNAARKLAYLEGEVGLARPGEDGGGDGEHAVGRHEQRGRGGVGGARRLPRRAERGRVVVAARATVAARRAERPDVEHVAAVVVVLGRRWWERRRRTAVSFRWLGRRITAVGVGRERDVVVLLVLRRTVVLVPPVLLPVVVVQRSACVRGDREAQ